MKRKWTSYITHNLGYKILSLLIAIVIWYAVVHVNDPVETASFPVAVEVVNGSYVENGKQLYRIEEEYKTVTVYVKANRSVISNLSAENISVTADLTQIIDFNRSPIMVPLTVTCSARNVDELTPSRLTIPIDIENIASKEFPVTVSTGDTSVDSNYEIGRMTPSIENVVLNGAESIINNIDSVVAKINVSGLSADRTVPAELVVIDKNQQEIVESVLQDDITWSEEAETITVDVELWRKRSDIDIAALYSGTPADGYQVSAVTTTPETLTVAGSEEALEKLREDGNVITIPESEISVAGLSSDQSYEIDISQYLPEDIILSYSVKDTVVVRVLILPLNSRELDIDVDDILIKGLGSDLTLSYDNPTVAVVFRAEDPALAAITAKDIRLTLDLTGYAPGDYEDEPLLVELPEGAELVSQPSLRVHIKERAEATENAAEAYPGS